MASAVETLRQFADTGGGAAVGYRRQGRQPAVVDQLRRLQDWRAENEAANAQHLQDLSSMGYVPGGTDPVVQQRAVQHVAEGMNIGGITAWHGSPHRFERFDPSKLGTGEGAQVYGHGLYLAENPKVAKQYAEDLSADRPSVEGHGAADMFNPVHIAAAGMAHHGNVKGAIGDLAESLKHPQLFGRDADVQMAAFRQAIDILRSGQKLPKVIPTEPQLYKVDLPDPHIAKMVDWDNPILRGPDNAFTLGRLQSSTDPTVQSVLGGMKPFHEGRDLLKQLNERGSPAQTSAIMQAHGIPGVKYWDQGSRGGLSSGNTSNFVVFPEFQKDLSILDRNGVPLGLAGGLP